ncbi:MAG: hypothetical protein ACI8ZN_000761 [Bacteroidia bacterium]|jgi:hypothetical protein
MSSKKKIKSSAPAVKEVKEQMSFDKDNYKWMLIGLAIIALGFILMYGKTEDQFTTMALFEGKLSTSTHIKITVAPIIVLLGFAVEIYAILKKPAVVNESV